VKEEVWLLISGYKGEGERMNEEGGKKYAVRRIEGEAALFSIAVVGSSGFLKETGWNREEQAYNGRDGGLTRGDTGIEPLTSLRHLKGASLKPPSTVVSCENGISFLSRFTGPHWESRVWGSIRL